LQSYFELLDSVENSSRSLFLSADNSVLAEAPVKDMIEALGALTVPAKAVVFDGIVSQRLLDVAHEKGIDTVIANRLGAVGKIPEGIRVVTKLDVEGPSAAR
ncbi:MAG: hypothetical protein ACHQ2Y_10370, partial [Candidatus Lutacidiplasmatales archaeon]